MTRGRASGPERRARRWSSDRRQCGDGSGKASRKKTRSCLLSFPIEVRVLGVPRLPPETPCLDRWSRRGGHHLAVPDRPLPVKSPGREQARCHLGKPAIIQGEKSCAHAGGECPWTNLTKKLLRC